MEVGKEEMVAAFRRKSHCDVKGLMERCYPLLRQDVLKGASASSLLEEWPFLFTLEGLVTTFHLLTSVDLRVALGPDRDGQIASLVTYMEEEAGVKAVRQLCSRRVTPALANASQLAVLPGSLLLLGAFFKEDLSVTLIERERSVELFWV